MQRETEQDANRRSGDANGAGGAPTPGPARGLTRRALLGTAAAGGAALALPGGSARARRNATPAAGATPTAETATTTLTQTAALGDPLSPGLPYRRLAPAGGWPLVVRNELAPPGANRGANRRPLVAFAHLTDLHVVDAASPGRAPFLRQYQGSFAGVTFDTAFRPQEALTGHVVAQMVERLNGIAAGPVTGRPFDFAVSTGDNADSAGVHELRTLITMLDGGSLPFNAAGGPYVGLQDASAETSPAVYDAFWHPDPAPAGFADDSWKREHGFPTLPGLLDAASRPIRSPGLAMPWYGGFGNHDILLLGVVTFAMPQGRFLELLAPGDRLPLALPPGMGVEGFFAALADASDAQIAALIERMPRRAVPAAAARRPFGRKEFVRMHLESAGRFGPAGHGFTPENLETGHAYYRFDLAPGIVGLMLDTTNQNGGADGSLDAAQAAWLQERLEALHGRHLSADGQWVETGHEDRLVVLFSHHNSISFDNVATAPDGSEPPRLGAQDFLALLRRFPNVILWVNGHTHTNRIWAHPDERGRAGGFWEVNTAAHIDYPQQSRTIEIADNGDGTLSILSVVVDHSDAEVVPGGPPYDQRSLAAIALELAANDPALDLTYRLGAPTDRNVELLVKRPF